VTPEAILAELRAYDPLRLPPGDMQRSAVLVPLRRIDPDQLELVLIRRAEEPGPHSGQVAFPGGRMEPGDESVRATALREAQEELGIPCTATELIGELDEMLTVTGYHVAPVVGLVDPAVVFVPEPREVARVFTVPVSVLLTPERWVRQLHRYRGSEVWVWHLPFDGEDIWGATAYMIRSMVERLWRAAGVDSRKPSW
jgi:8-oxo-dGTP pyrophosphatase MutT (NUDIX family)